VLSEKKGAENSGQEAIFHRIGANSGSAISLARKLRMTPEMSHIWEVIVGRLFGRKDTVSSMTP
jgi:hypothetical protein